MKIQSIVHSTSPDVPASNQLLSRISSVDASFIPRKVDKPLVVYGAGNLGKMAYEYFNYIGIEVDIIIDKNADKYRNDEFWSGVDIVSPDDVRQTVRDNSLLVVSIVTTPFVELAAILHSAGWKDIIPFYDVSEAYRERHPLSNGWYAEPFTSYDIEKISRVLSVWDDDVSRAHHLQFIAWRRLRQEWIFKDADVIKDNRYFIPEITNTLTKSECFADVGAHHGEVTVRFISETEANFENIWLIEPDVDNLSELRRNLSDIDSNSLNRLKTLPLIVGKSEAYMGFIDGLGYASQLSELSVSKHPVTTIDKLNISPTFMKYHLEGAELSALKGSILTLTKCRPMLVATAYHNSDGIWVLPDWLMDNLPGYRFYMRLHSWCGTGAVIYSIPEERFGT